MKLFAFLAVAGLIMGGPSDDRFCDVPQYREPLKSPPLNPALKIPRPEMIA